MNFPFLKKKYRVPIILLVIALAGVALYFCFRFPPDTTPEGAYMRIASNLGRGDAKTCFSYLEDKAQHAAYSIRDYRKKSSDLISKTFPEHERSKWLEKNKSISEAPDGSDVWVIIANQNGWILKMRNDLSGISKVEISGDRATVETVKGTRFAFRRRENKIWGLTQFTAILLAESEKAARDWLLVQKSADDYQKFGK